VNININADKILKAIKDNPLSVLVVALFCICILFAYLYYNERDRVTVNCDEQVEKLQNEFTNYQIKCNNEIIDIRKECRNKLDSIEDDYYFKYIDQGHKIRDIEHKLHMLTKIVK
jgi:hypothetical protein